MSCSVIAVHGACVLFVLFILCGLAFIMTVKHLNKYVRDCECYHFASVCREIIFVVK